MSHPILLAGALVAAGVVIVLATLVASRRPRGQATTARVAHVERLRDLPSYASAVRRRRWGLAATSVLLVAAIGLGGYVAARPMIVQTRQSHLDNRDIVLCLDVSGSMTASNLAIVRTFRQLVSGLDGERISLVLFNSVPLVVFPLTDDYDLVRTRLAEAEVSLDPDSPRGSGAVDITAGTVATSIGASLVGDGLMGCAQQFSADAALAELRDAGAQPGPAQSERSRIVILATDNQQSARSEQLYTVAESAERARSLGAVVVALDANPTSDTRPAQELAAAAEATGGATYPAASGADAIPKITAIVESLDSATVQGAPVMSAFDVPGRALSALLALMVCLGIAWRVVLP
ncbi:VWA domain-containing protein [Cellulomonas timonensis]|uniref:VWA domain-containing protein n=1 Tax=Cellulomonas timonensis TaxID=1689271 RepID=UPI00131AFF12|nr:vWA domain-containing protein [Cellulomonas timonensis]